MDAMIDNVIMVDKGAERDKDDEDDGAQVDQTFWNISKKLSSPQLIRETVEQLDGFRDAGSMVDETHDDDDDDDGGNNKSSECKCKNSRCLKLYCECFGRGRYCDPERCRCDRCCNNQANQAYHHAAVAYALSRNDTAFRAKKQQAIASSSGHGGSTSKESGCNCRKSSCLKRYCECFQANMYCTDKCNCQSCENFQGGSVDRQQPRPPHAVESPPTRPPATYRPFLLDLDYRKRQLTENERALKRRRTTEDLEPEEVQEEDDTKQKLEKDYQALLKSLRAKAKLRSTPMAPLAGKLSDQVIQEFSQRLIDRVKEYEQTEVTNKSEEVEEEQADEGDELRCTEESLSDEENDALDHTLPKAQQSVRIVNQDTSEEEATLMVLKDCLEEIVSLVNQNL